MLRFSFWGAFKDLDMWREIAARFEEENPDLRIKLEYIPTDYDRRLGLTLITGTAPDLMLMNDKPYPSYAVRGYLEDLGPYIERDQEALKLDDWLPTAMENFNYEGFQGGISWDGFPVLLFYNRDMFDAAGLDYPSADWTWEDVRRVAKELTKDLDGDGRFDQFGALFTFHHLEFQPIMWSYGGRMLNDDKTRSMMNSPEALAAAQLWYDMRWEDYSIPQAGDMEGFLAEVQLLTGRLGMLSAGAYLMITLDAIKTKMGWGIAHMPKGPDGLRYTRVSWDGISINAQTPHKEECWKFIKFLLSEEIQAYIGRIGRGIPVRRTDAENYFVKPDSGVPEEIALEALEYGRLTPSSPRYLELRQVIGEEFDKLNVGTSTPPAVLRAVETKMNEVLAREVAPWQRD